MTETHDDAPWLYSLREETKRITERTNQLKKENERLRKEIEALSSITSEKLSEIVTKSMSKHTYSQTAN